MKSGIRTASCALLALAWVAAVSCGGVGENREEGMPARGLPVRGGTARVGVIQEPGTFVDWIAGTNVDLLVADLVFRRLARPGASPGTFEPDLAESWQVAADGGSVVFRVRDGIRWEDGRELTAADIVFSEQRGRDPDSSIATFKGAIGKVEAIGPREVRFEFAHPYPEMFADAVRGHVYPRHVLESVPFAELPKIPFNRKPVGSGPFRLESWEPQQYLSFAPRRDGPGDGPLLDRLVLRIFADKDAALRELEGGGVDLLFRVPREAARKLSSRDDLVVRRNPTRGFAFVVWNTRRPPWDRAEARQGATALLDRKAIAERFEGTEAALAESPVPRDHPWFDPSVRSQGFDASRAETFFRAAGWTRSSDGSWRAASGEPVRTTVFFQQGNALLRDVAALVTDGLRRGGIEVEAREIELPALEARKEGGDFDALLLARPSSSPVDLAGCFGRGGAENYGALADDTLSGLLDVLASETDPTRARAAFGSAVRRIVDLQPWTFLFFRSDVVVANRRLRGLEACPHDPVAAADRWWIAETRD